MSKLPTLLQKTVPIYDSDVVAVLVEDGDRQTVYVPIRPLVDALGVDYSAQYRRVRQNPVLSEVAATVVMDTAGGPQDVVALPLTFINGFLFGINASRVKADLRERLIAYQRHCYEVLAAAMLPGGTAVAPSPATGLEQVYQMGMAIARLAHEQMAFDARLTTQATVVDDLSGRVAQLEQRLSPGDPVTEEQASQISQAVKAVAVVLGNQTKRNEFGAVYGELYRKFGITSYKLLPAEKFGSVMEWLTNWHQSLVGDAPF